MRTLLCYEHLPYRSLIIKPLVGFKLRWLRRKGPAMWCWCFEENGLCRLFCVKFSLWH